MHQNHIIQKNILEVEMENPADAFQFRNRLGEVMHEKLLPQLEQLFNDITANGQVYRLERLEVDAGVLQASNWQDELAARAIADIRRQLVLQEPVWQEPTAGSSLPTGKGGSHTTHLPKNEATGSHQVVEIILFYLLHGYLPWFAPAGFRFQPQLHNFFSDEHLAAIKQALQHGGPAAITRLLLITPGESLHTLLVKLTPASGIELLPQLEQFYKAILQQQAAATALPSHLSLAFWRQWLYASLLRWLAAHPNSSPAHQWYVGQLLEAIPANTNATALVQKWVTQLHQLSPTPFIKVFVAALDGTLEVVTAEQPAIEPKTEETKTRDTLPHDGLYVENAGLVLLHPFLSILFAELKLTEQHRFVTPIAAERAVLLTQYLVAGYQPIEDHQLVLNKIVCGLPFNQPLATDIIFTPHEMTEADDLLQQVLTMWKHNNVQVNTTVQGLREAFLQRPGRLIQKDTNCNLRVEQQPYDMVMSSLPWGISMVKTPWMQGMMWVEW